MSSSAGPQIPQLPAPTAPTPDPAAEASDSRDLRKEKEAEAKSEQDAAKAKAARFAPKKRSAAAAPSAAPEFETLILAPAVNLPPMVFDRPAVSTFVPNLSIVFYVLNYMDFLMASTKRWIDNCMGWAPPYSQAYISVLLYVQIMRAMEAAGVVLPGSDIANILLSFNNLYPLNELWIPGPLVSAFRSLSAFDPSALGHLGNVTPSLPATPGWTVARHGCLADNIEYLLPNVSVFFERLRQVSAAAAASTNEELFYNSTSGPRALRTLFGNTVANSQTLTRSPGAHYTYGGNRQLWINARYALNAMNVPANIDVANVTLHDRWTAVMRLDLLNGEHTWFGPVSAMMAKYCQFFNGSASLGSCAPVTSAACAIKSRVTTMTGILDQSTSVAAAGDGSSHTIGDTNCEAHLRQHDSGRYVHNVRHTMPDLPDAFYFAGSTWAFNSYWSNDVQLASRTGDFWTIAPDYAGRDGIEVLPGVLSSIMREYHSDVRLSPFKG